jgi:hypothetical protein
MVWNSSMSLTLTIQNWFHVCRRRRSFLAAMISGMSPFEMDMSTGQTLMPVCLLSTPAIPINQHMRVITDFLWSPMTFGTPNLQCLCGCWDGIVLCLRRSQSCSTLPCNDEWLLYGFEMLTGSNPDGGGICWFFCLAIKSIWSDLYRQGKNASNYSTNCCIWWNFDSSRNNRCKQNTILGYHW